ncbi:SDR family NAD(P)-dependent oxidoreductase [Demequina muriae]|uniref:SDR family NAD(P)-dependent oxidoreductase n=1 Tax=Demequina muriae TaxID=3051664 RepID=A0ABT8GGB6_9MICO|nr:SDR family NAD(P)-dependent oxidoreductase [Demequina sp. EGI L300058]MDN4480467.1 SDR family NAD(P)-dependent oxidoreductase [Demequina sp. EGI L300058]
MSAPLAGKVAVVTGSGQGIGRDIALCMAEAGAGVITNNRKPGSSLDAFEKTTLSFSDEEREALENVSGDAQTTADEILRRGGEAVPFFGDVGDFEVARRMVETAIETFGRVDIVVNNASSNWVGNFMDMDEDLWDVSVVSKLKGAFNLMHHSLPHMKRQGYGRILNSSSDAFLGLEGYAAYGAANAGLVALTKGAAQDVRAHGITVNAYTPLAKTRAWYNAAATYRLQGVPAEAVEAAAPAAMKRTAEGMVPFLAYLGSDDAADITGHLFRLAADGEIGLWSTPEVVTSIRTDAEAWSMSELRARVPNELLKDVVGASTSLPVGQRDSQS